MAAAASGVASAKPRMPNRAPNTSWFRITTAGGNDTARLDQGREQVALQELHDGVEPGDPQRKREAFSTRHQHHGHGADDRSRTISNALATPKSTTATEVAPLAMPHGLNWLTAW